jgi:hypothetical protein
VEIMFWQLSSSDTVTDSGSVAVTRAAGDSDRDSASWARAFKFRVQVTVVSVVTVKLVPVCLRLARSDDHQ